ncbi:hypothetical protein HMPREF1324_0333 [Rothia aeria F0474]|uniref:Uncharacterized protein n=1 Tax=Rothia aeria F0474 TaxID=1125724 RepID=I0URT8_9MICC|nr:hypothetical protein HMPREF1324_0333 [Rothia aeria F0474]
MEHCRYEIRRWCARELAHYRRCRTSPNCPVKGGYFMGSAEAVLLAAARTSGPAAQRVMH